MDLWQLKPGFKKIVANSNQNKGSPSFRNIRVFKPNHHPCAPSMLVFFRRSSKCTYNLMSLKDIYLTMSRSYLLLLEPFKIDDWFSQVGFRPAGLVAGSDLCGSEERSDDHVAVGTRQVLDRSGTATANAAAQRFSSSFSLHHRAVRGFLREQK